MPKQIRKNDEVQVTVGSGNVFADIGMANADERLLKAQLATIINGIIGARPWTQAQAAKHLGVDQPRISALQRGRLAPFSLHKLMRFAVRLGCAVEVVVRQEDAMPGLRLAPTTQTSMTDATIARMRSTSSVIPATRVSDSQTSWSDRLPPPPTYFDAFIASQQKAEEVFA